MKYVDIFMDIYFQSIVAICEVQQIALSITLQTIFFSLSEIFCKGKRLTSSGFKVVKCKLQVHVHFGKNEQLDFKGHNWFPWKLAQ